MPRFHFGISLSAHDFGVLLAVFVVVIICCVLLTGWAVRQAKARIEERIN